MKQVAKKTCTKCNKKYNYLRFVKNEYLCINCWRRSKWVHLMPNYEKAYQRGLFQAISTSYEEDE